MMYGVIGFVCFVFGFIFACCCVVNKYYSGEMEVDYTDPAKDIYRMHVNDFNKIDKSKYVLFKVKRTHE